jgi:hypothetical protein
MILPRHRAGIASFPAVASAFPLEVSPDPIEIGALGAGESRLVSVNLRNTRNTELMLDRIVTSCPCVRVEQVPARIAPAETASLKIRVDGESESNYGDWLAVEIGGYLPDGTVAFRMKVRFQRAHRSGEGE